METKDGLFRCTKCLVFQPKDNFHKKKNILGIKSVCKSCRSTERKIVYSKNREEEIEYGRLYKQNNPEKRKEQQNRWSAKNYVWFRDFLNAIKNVSCLDCGRIFPPCSMDFDHRDASTKMINVSEMATFSEKDILDEIAKCDIVCANCHRIRSFNRRASKNISAVSAVLIDFKNMPCVDCGLQFPWYAMDFDHLDPSQKRFDPSKPSKTPKGKTFRDNLLEEISKCELVCANCHRIRTFIKKVAA